MADGTIIIESQLDTKKLQQQLKAQEKELSKVTTELDKARETLAAMEAEYREITKATREIASETHMSDEETDAFIRNSVKGAAELESKMQRTAEQIDAATARQAELKTQMGYTVGQITAIASSEEDVKTSTDRAAASFAAFTKKVTTLAKRLFVFSLVTKALRGLRDYLSAALNSSDAFKEGLSQLKGSLLIAFQPLLSVVIPALISFINLIARAANLIAQFAQWIGGLFGKNVSGAAKALYDQAKATKAAGDAAEKAQRQMSGLDEMNTWQEQNAGGGAVGGGTVSPDFSLGVAKEVTWLDAVVAGAVFALGAILTFTGTNIPLGIALMAAGAVKIVDSVKALNWNSVKDKLQGSLNSILSIVGVAGLVIGAVLAFSGVNIPLGIGLMLGGAASLGGLVALNWDAVRDKLKQAWENIKSWFNSNVKPKFTKAYWQEKFNTIGDGLKTAIKNGLNAAISLLNRFVAWVNEKMTWTIGDSKLAKVLGISPATYQIIRLKQIPMLAQGAVIPANHAFMAVLGDQKQGRNIEAPEDLIRQIVREEAGKGTITFVAQLDGHTLFKEVVRQAKTEKKINGFNAFNLG